MRAAYKGTVIDAVLFYGELSGAYPKWFNEQVLEGCYRDSGTLQYRLTDETDIQYEFYTLVPFKSVFLKNRYGDILPLHIDKFSELYYEMGQHRAALKTDCVEYFIFVKDTTPYIVPDWLHDLILDGYIVMEKDVRSFFDKDGEYAMSPTCVFIRNRKGEVKYLETSQFEQYFEPNGRYLLGEHWNLLIDTEDMRILER